MAEFIRTEEKVVNVGEPVIFENNTDSDFSVSAAVVFRKSGLYDVSIVGRRTIISKVAERIRTVEELPTIDPERKMGKWIVSHVPGSMLWECNQCGFDCGAHSFNFCPMCGAKMER